MYKFKSSLLLELDTGQDFQDMGFTSSNGEINYLSDGMEYTYTIETDNVDNIPTGTTHIEFQYAEGDEVQDYPFATSSEFEIFFNPEGDNVNSGSIGGYQFNQILENNEFETSLGFAAHSDEFTEFVKLENVKFYKGYEYETVASYTEDQIVNDISFDYESNDDLENPFTVNSPLVDIADTDTAILEFSNMADGDRIATIGNDNDMYVFGEDEESLLGESVFADGEIQSEWENLIFSSSESQIQPVDSEIYSVDVYNREEVSATTSSDDGEEIPSFIVGQTVSGEIGVQGDVYQDYYYEDTEVSYTHATNYIVDVESGNYISQGEWTDLQQAEDVEGEAGVYNVEYAHNFEETYYEPGEYAFGVTVVQSTAEVTNVEEDEGDSFEWEWSDYDHERVHTTEYEFAVVEADEPLGLLDSLNVFFGSIVDSIVDSLTTTFEEGSLQLPSLEQPEDF